jgi:DNA-binding NarL/FixJ family response regulator
LSEKLNKKATAYVEGRCSFNDVYDTYLDIYEKEYEKIAAVKGLDPYEVQASYEDTLLKTLQEYQPNIGKYTNYLNKSLKNKVADLQRKQQRLDREIPADTIEAEDGEVLSIFYMIPSDIDVETEVINKKISDKQRSLIAILISATNTFEDERMIQVFESIKRGDTIHAASRAANICHKTVKRRLRKIANMYDSEKYGEIYDYFSA